MSVRYAVLMYADPVHTVAMSESELDEIARKHEAFRNDLTASGELTGGAGLALPEETAVLRLGADGALTTAHGPIASEAVDHLTAYYEIECDTAERAHEIGSRVLDHHVVAVELRRIHDTA